MLTPQSPGGTRFVPVSPIAGSPEPDPERDAIGRTLGALLAYNQATLRDSPHPLKVGSCVQDCLVVQQVLLAEFGISGLVACADLAAWNANFRLGVVARYEGRKAQFHRPGAPPWSVEVSHGMANPTARHAGHAVLRTARYTADPTLGQLWRSRGGRVLLDPPPVAVYENRLFGPLDPARDGWLTWPRPGLFHSNGAGADDTMGRLVAADLGPLLRNYGPGRDQVAVVMFGSDCWVATLLRPDLRIEDTYARWLDPGFREYTGGMAERVTAILRGARSGAA